MSDDTQTIRRVLSGDTEAFRALVERYERPLLCFVRNLVGDAQRSEDVVQEVFLSAYRHLGRFDARRGRFSTWLFAMARNAALSAAKRRPAAAPADPPPRADTRTPDRQAAAAELFARLDAALASLPVEQRTAFVLSEFVGLGHEDISAIEGVAAGTIRSRLSRAKVALRSLLSEYAGGVT